VKFSLPERPWPIAIGYNSVLARRCYYCGLPVQTLGPSATLLRLVHKESTIRVN